MESQSQGRDRMKFYSVGRIASGVLVIVLSAFSLMMAAAPGYHLLKKYSFGAAEGATREYFDYITVDSAARRVYLSHGTEIKVIDADSGALITNITGLKQDHGVAVASEFGRGFISDGAQGKAIIFDLQSLKVAGEAPTALAMDVPPHRLFSAGRNPQMLVVLDSDSGKVLQSFPISAGVDAAAYEPETGLLFVSTREGMVHVFHEDSPDKFSEAETIKTEYGAKTMGLDTKTHNLFLDTADFGPAPAPTTERPHPQRPAIQGTFHVLVYGK